MDRLSLGELFHFDKMIAPTIIKIVYWLGLAGFGLALIALLLSLATPAGSITTMLGGLIAIAFGVLFWRIVMELYSVLFGIYDRLGEVRDHMKP